MFEDVPFDIAERSLNTERGFCLTTQQPTRLLAQELNRAFQVRGPDAGVDLRRVDALMAEQRADLLEIAVLPIHLHGHAVSQVMWLELRHADRAAVKLCEPPEILARHRLPGAAHDATTPRRPEQRRLGRHLARATG